MKIVIPARKTKIEIPVSQLRQGLVIADGQNRITVFSIEACSGHRKGIPRYHVNKSNCYDSISYVTIVINDQKEELS
jgi:hypothetical protein